MRKRLTQAARCAIVMRSQENDKRMAVVKLRKDLINGPLHCFGYHKKCSTDFCKVKQNSHPSSSNMSSLPHGSTLSPPHCSSSSVSTPSLPISSSSFLSNPSLSHSNTPSLSHSSTPSLPHSSTPSLQYTNIRSLREWHFTAYLMQMMIQVK